MDKIYSLRKVINKDNDNDIIEIFDNDDSKAKHNQG